MRKLIIILTVTAMSTATLNASPASGSRQEKLNPPEWIFGNWKMGEFGDEHSFDRNSYRENGENPLDEDVFVRVEDRETDGFYQVTQYFQSGDYIIYRFHKPVDDRILFEIEMKNSDEFTAHSHYLRRTTPGDEQNGAQNASAGDLKPYYAIDFNVVACGIDIRVNDISVFTIVVEGQMASAIPVNQAILETGKQQITYHIQPLPGETALHAEAKFTAAVWLYDASNDYIEKVEELPGTSFVFPENATDTPLPSFKGETVFDAEVPYRFAAWKNSADLHAVPNLRQKLETAYRNLGEMINKKQYDAFKNLMREKEKRMAASMYLNEQESEERMSRLIEYFESGLQLIPLSGNETICFYANGKLVGLKTEDGSSALRFEDKETGDKLSVEILFHLKEGDAELTVSP
ncbi:MAG: hypothetical protein LBE91_04175 [Tannerella sp.]|nr:hypothetical protein [Tannerella sp.]